ncbi:pentapeptide repeat-containing protein [bacterium]|nr:pentapeptide repeat-containing protein [bacterium]
MRRFGHALLGAAAALLIGLVLWQVPQWQTAEWRGVLSPREQLELENQVRQTLAILLGAGAFLTGLALLWWRVGASERAASDAVRLAEDSQRRERFTRAVGQLADDRLEVRLGAIYALEQVANESAQQHQPAMEVLCAYLRERAAWEPERPAPSRLATDVQAVLTVLGRRAVAHEAGGGFRLDLRRTDLRGADLNGVNLERANLFESHLEGATMQAARLAHADLRGAWLDNADLVEADLRGADLREAHLDGTYMVEARLEGADLGGAHLAGAYLGGASLQGADLGGAHLDGAYLYKANLEGASLHAARVVSTIGVPRDERERVNRTAAALDAPPSPSAARPRAGEPAAKPAVLRRARR